MGVTGSSSTDSLAWLCLRLAETTGPIAAPGTARTVALRAVAAARRNDATEGEVAPLLADLDAELRQSGLPGGMGRYRTTPPPGVGYRSLPGVTAHAVHEVLRCPGFLRCARVEGMTWTARLDPPQCAVHDTSLVTERIRG
ncbi:hypothetical protein [Streptomyces sp. NBC_00878]|uniref:hypothetical protein n=1 Tax=Streptomyces sp. NBC_00878 TaxID=2975854 RepID=UPI002258F9AE|nr:hypothetical protein [Streptomyces sp. NBC_00878]MCX4907696.1 hypothetical protein [Streptomyces sp. NBC_00878]